MAKLRFRSLPQVYPRKRKVKDQGPSRATTQSKSGSRAFPAWKWVRRGSSPPSQGDPESTLFSKLKLKLSVSDSRHCLGAQLYFVASVRSAPLIQDLSFLAISSAPRSVRWRRPLVLLPLTNTCQHIDSFPRFCASISTDYAVCSWSWGARWPLFTLPYSLPRTGLIVYSSSNVQDTNDWISTCGIDLFHRFLVFSLATPDRTSTTSFEPLPTTQRAGHVRPRAR